MLRAPYVNRQLRRRVATAAATTFSRLLLLLLLIGAPAPPGWCPCSSWLVSLLHACRYARQGGLH